MEEQICAVLTQLVQKNSINLTLSNGPGEMEIANFIASYLGQIGISAKIHEVAPARANVTAVIPGKNESDALLLNGHLDTVGVEGMADPFKLKREGDRLYGRGTYDMKGSLAVMLVLADYFSKQPPPVSLLLTFTGDEEDKSLGMEHLVKHWLPTVTPTPSGAVFMEPTELDIGVCHKGFVWYEVDVTGKAAHGSRPAEGTDAILPLQAALTELSRIQAELDASTPHPLLGLPSLHAGIIQGGTELSVIPSSAKLMWERRTLPTESDADLDRELARVIQAVRDYDGDHRVEGSTLFVRPPYQVPEDAQVLQRLTTASPESRQIGLSFWADSALGGLAGIPSVLFGPVGHGAHAVDEWVSLSSLVSVYETIKTLILAH